MQNNFPSNVLVLLSHGSYLLPKEFELRLNKSFLLNDKRLLKNFSDWGTEFLVSDKIPENQVLRATYSRAIGDPNRARDAFDIFRETDFGGVKLWDNPLSLEEKEYLLKNFYDVHHNLVKQKIQEFKKNNKNIFVIDVHDTGNLLMGEDFSDDRLKEKLFPKLAICDCEGKLLTDELKDIVEKSFLSNLDTGVVWNDPYKFSFTSNYYSDKENGIYTLQVEFGRYLLIDEKTQTYSKESEKIKEGLYKALVEIGEFLNN